MPEANDTVRNLKEYLASEHPIVEATIPSKDKKEEEKPKPKKWDKPDWADKKSDDFNDYEYNDNDKQDDKEW